MSNKLRPGWIVAAFVGTLLGLLVLVVVWRAHRARTGEWFGESWIPRSWFEKDAGESRNDEAIAAAPIISWCAPGLEAIPGGGCLALPEKPGGKPTTWPLVIYLHGIFDPAAPGEEVARQTRMAERAVASGFAFVALRGHVGQCTSPEYASRVCWPSNERNAEAGPAYVAEWRAPLAIARRRGASGRRYLVGFSNGGYFAGLLAERSWFDAAAFVVARAGPVEPVKAVGRKTPMLLTLSDGDASHDEMVKLDLELDRDGWAHKRLLTHGGHTLADADVEAAMSFFEEEEHRPSSP
jgi:dienelactone hydrolase